MRPLISSLVIASLFVAGLAVDLNAAPAVEISRRVVGLFEPSRVDDLKQVVPTLPGVELVQVDYASTVAVWRLDPALVMTSYNAKKPPTEEQLAQRLDSLLGAASIRTFALKPLAGIPAEKATLVQLRPPILDCRGCRFAVYNSIAKLEGVEIATVGKDGLISARIDPAKTDHQTLLAALKKVRGLEHPIK
jgi:copper chaperone CopZ